MTDIIEGLTNGPLSYILLLARKGHEKSIREYEQKIFKGDIVVKSLIRDRRQWSRAERILSIEYRLHKSHLKNADRSWHLTTTEGISLGGLSFYSDYEYRLEDVLEVRVVMSGFLNVYNGLGRITRVERKKTGVCYYTALKFLNERREEDVMKRQGHSRQIKLCRRRI